MCFFKASAKHGRMACTSNFPAYMPRCHRRVRSVWGSQGLHQSGLKSWDFQSTLESAPPHPVRQFEEPPNSRLGRRRAVRWLVLGVLIFRCAHPNTVNFLAEVSRSRSQGSAIGITAMGGRNAKQSPQLRFAMTNHQCREANAHPQLRATRNNHKLV